MEAHALALGMRWLSRNKESHSQRVVLLIDALAVRGAARKGRTSAPTLTTALKRCAAISLACDWLTHVPYIPSESMPADKASRGLQPRRHTGLLQRLDRKIVKPKTSPFDIKWANEQRRHEWLNKWLHDHHFLATWIL